MSMVNGGRISRGLRGVSSAHGPWSLNVMADRAAGLPAFGVVKAARGGRLRVLAVRLPRPRVSQDRPPEVSPADALPWRRVRSRFAFRHSEVHEASECAPRHMRVEWEMVHALGLR